ncbi:MAG: hypothetical protein N3A69_08470, partial [Leptospiraceae bacterium]|nr:hypothetical protein [Leptospiraceae bacterium]
MKIFKVYAILSFILILVSGASYGQLKEGEPIVFGVPTALGSIEGRDSWMSVQMAVEEINKKGGIRIGTRRHEIRAYAIDTREHEPGI